MAVSGTLVKRIMVRVTADDMDADEKLDAITAKADELAAKNPELKVKIDSAAAMAKMKVLRDELKASLNSAISVDPAAQAAAEDRMSRLAEGLDKMHERADELKESFAGDKEQLAKLLSLDAGVEGLKEKLSTDHELSAASMASAEARLAGMDVDLDKMKAKADSSGSNGLLGRILLGRNSESSGFLGGLVKWIPGIGESASSGIGGIGNIGTEAASEGEGAAGGGPEGIASAAGMLGAIIDAAAAASTEITGVVSGFAAAGVGAGAFALLAYPAVKQVTGALGDTKGQLLKLPLLEQDAVGDLQQLDGTWKQMSKAFQPQAFKVFTDFLELADELLPKVTPFATAFAGAIDGLLKRADSFVASKGFTDWLGQLEKLVGPSTTAIGSGIGNVAGSLGKLLTLMSSKDDVNAINIAFSVIDGAIVGFAGFVHYSMVTWDAMTTAWDTATDAIRRGGHYAAEGFDITRHAAAILARDTPGAFDVVRHAAATGGHDVATGFDVARHGAATAGDAIEKQADRTGSFVRTHWKEIAGWIASPIGMAVFEIRTHTHQIAQEFDQLRHDTASILAGMRHDVARDFDGIRHDIASDLDTARHDIAHWTDDTVSFFAALPGRTVRALEHWADDLFHSGDTSVKSMGRGAAAAGTGVLSWFEGLPGRIVHALDRLAGDLFSAGQNALIGLVHGIEAGAASIPSVMMGLAHEVENYFTDPLKIFSPSRVMYEHGLMVPEGAALGIEAGTPRIRQAAAGMARAVSGTALGAHGTTAGTAAAGSHITIQISGDAALRQWLKKSIRVTGGNVQVVGA